MAKAQVFNVGVTIGGVYRGCNINNLVTQLQKGRVALTGSRGKATVTQQAGSSLVMVVATMVSGKVYKYKCYNAFKGLQVAVAFIR